MSARDVFFVQNPRPPGEDAAKPLVRVASLGKSPETLTLN